MQVNANMAMSLISAQTESLDNKLLQQLSISDNGFVFDPITGQSFTVNETGVELLRLFQQESNIEVVVRQQCKKYKADSREIERDILDFTSNLNRYFHL